MLLERTSSRALMAFGLTAGAALLGGASPALANGEKCFDKSSLGYVACPKPEDWKLTIDLRFRSENVEQDNLPDDAQANTFRQRYGLISPWYEFVRVGAEFESVLEVGPSRYNNTFNGQGNFPVVADVESNELNQGWVELKPFDGTLLKAGRFVEALNNQRYFGHVGWRQNNQTFDGLKLTNTSLLPDTKLYYGYILNANRIFSESSTRTVGPLQGDLETNIHLGEVTYSGLPFGTLRLYNYYTEQFSDVDALSSNTTGGAFYGKELVADGLVFKYYLEYAHQTDAADNPNDYGANYVHIAPALSYAGFTLTGGYELLGSDNNVGFSTPFATLHKFNGWADQFLATPGAGLQDLYVDATYKFSGVDGPLSGFVNGALVKLQYHDFSTQRGDLDIAEEFGAYVKVPLKPIVPGLYAELKYADFMDDDSNAVRTTDVEKLILGLGYKQTFDLHEFIGVLP